MRVFSYQRTSPGTMENGSTPRRGLPKAKSTYNWHLYSPNDSSFWHNCRWFVVGGAAYAPETEAQLNENLTNLAELITLLREYKQEYGLPENGGSKDQEMVLREVLRDLYAGGTPLWALSPVMQKAAEGLTGQKHVNWMILPRKAFVSDPEHQYTSMFRIDRGFDISKLDDMETVVVRLASFASNTDGVSDLPSVFPSPTQLQRAALAGSTRNLAIPSQESLAESILSLASKSQGLFFFVNSRGYVEHQTELDPFWIISDDERELFSRLATVEAMQMIEEIDANKKKLYPAFVIVLFRVLASFGACAFWFNGSWPDCFVAGVLAVFIAIIGESSVLSKQEKIVYETVASFVVGAASGLIALTWPNDTCFGAMAIAGVLDILQGFRVVYAVIETMSKHTVAGGADLLEGILFTGLIAYFLRFGQYTAASILTDDPDKAVFTDCTNGIDPYWYILLVPLASLAWSGLFNPKYGDLMPMCLHGCLAYGVNYGLSVAGAADNLNNFVSAFAVSLSAGILSRFTGRQAVGNTVAGLYVLLPGAYLVRSIFVTELNGNFFADIIQRAVIIGIGAWSGSVVCSPTLLGTTKGLLGQQQPQSNRSLRRNLSEERTQTMLLF